MALTKLGMPGYPFWCQKKALYLYLYAQTTWPKPLRRETRPRTNSSLSPPFRSQSSRTPPAHKLVALFDFLSSNSRLSHSSSLKLSSADGCETHETETVATDKHTKYLRGHPAVVAPSKTIASRHRPRPDYYTASKTAVELNIASCRTFKLVMGS